MSVTPTVPAPLPAAPSKVKTFLSKALAGFLTAATSSAAIKAEKSIAVTVITGTLLSVGASAALIDVVVKAVQAL